MKPEKVTLVIEISWLAGGSSRCDFVEQGVEDREISCESCNWALAGCGPVNSHIAKTNCASRERMRGIITLQSDAASASPDFLSVRFFQKLLQVLLPDCRPGVGAVTVRPL